MYSKVHDMEYLGCSIQTFDAKKRKKKKKRKEIMNWIRNVCSRSLIRELFLLIGVEWQRSVDLFLEDTTDGDGPR